MIKIKKYVSASLLIFFVVTLAVLSAGLVFYDKSKNVDINSNVAGPNNANNVSSPASAFYTVTEIAKHNKTGDCWLIISGQVYDVSSYMYQHPGSKETIIPYCGAEASKAFATKGGNGPNHSNGAYALLKKYLIGSLK